MLRDGDGGSERILGGRGVRTVALEQDFAFAAMEEWVCPVLSRLLRERQPGVHRGKGVFDAPGDGFELGHETIGKRAAALFPGSR